MVIPFLNTEYKYFTKYSQIGIILHQPHAAILSNYLLLLSFIFYIKTYQRNRQDDWEWQPNHNLTTQIRWWSNELKLTRAEVVMFLKKGCFLIFFSSDLKQPLDLNPFQDIP